MTSKQEKLAAARRKLKEFQGKNKEADILKQRNINDSLRPAIAENSSNDLVIHNNSLISGRENVDGSFQGTGPSYTKHSTNKQTSEGIFNERKISESSLSGGNSSKLYLENFNQNIKLVNDTTDFSVEKSDCTNGLRADPMESHEADEKNNFYKNSFSSSISKDGSEMKKTANLGSADVPSFNDSVALKSTEDKNFFESDASNKSCLNDVIKPLQIELQNHAQTITILVQQRNDAQAALAETQNCLSQKSEEANELKQQVAHLTSSTKNVSQRLSDAESVIMKLKLEKEDNLTRQDKLKTLADERQAQLDEKEEEFQEMKRKHEDKSRECQQLLFGLQEAQSQLSLCQIQLQQFQHSTEGHSNLVSQVSELQNENLSLKQKIVELEKKLETENAEKEETSQKFHIYAQQCNSQLNALNSQLKSLKLENENLTQENKILSENLADLERSKENAASPESFESEIANLHNQLSALSEKNNGLNCSLKQKEDECGELESKLNEKEVALSQLLGELKELEEENKILAKEAETPKANERLLATMESDKIAAAKAVSQNQKLKEQVLELEKAFMKISEEKLELTNQLAHEKHLNTELQNLLKNADPKHQNGDHHHDHDCHQGHEQTESLVNDSNEVEELRNIVRQLQDDKMELTTRLSSYESNKESLHEEREKRREKNCEHETEHDHEDVQCEHTKLLLQQMEEKVKKTMNEIAVLDEEKEKLEHLVLQLQGETETIGEYITLYQKQRMLLRQRAQEKDIQLLQLSKDKEELKSKLVALDELVQRLIAEKENISVQPVSKLPAAQSTVVTPENTAGKIRALINEIGSTTLIDNQTIAFEHCPCCSGRLITI